MAQTRSKETNHQPAEAQEPAGPAFQRLAAELAAQRQLGTEQAAEVDGLQAEMAKLEARLAAARQAAHKSEQRCGQLDRELEELKPRLGYEFNLPQDASLAIIGWLGKARCRAARACRGLRAAVGSAKDLGAFRHRVLAITAAGMQYANGTAGHTVVCTGDAVFSFGTDSGQLGYAAESQAPAPASSDSESDGEPGLYQLTPRVVAGLLAEDVVAAAASECSTLVCTAQGRAYWFGELSDRRAEQFDDEYTTIIIKFKVPRLVGGLERLVGVAAGENHLLAWTGSGELYTWGDGYFGQLGHGGTEQEAGPRLVEGLAGQQVVGADGGNSCNSACHSVACTASGRVYTFGAGRSALGHGEDAANDQLTPRVVEGLAGSTVVAVAAGTNITAAATEAGELYTWGWSDFGALGHGEGNTRESLPRLVAGLAGRMVAGVAAGAHHKLAWTDSGELYSWGAGYEGQLGHNCESEEWSPRRVEGLAGKVVVGAAAGIYHSVVATREQVYTFGILDGLLDAYVPQEVTGLKVP